jgi:hypothetical protein
MGEKGKTNHLQEPSDHRKSQLYRIHDKPSEFICLKERDENQETHQRQKDQIPTIMYEISHYHQNTRNVEEH